MVLEMVLGSKFLSLRLGAAAPSAPGRTRRGWFGSRSRTLRRYGRCATQYGTTRHETYDAFERLRARVVHTYGRVDPAVCGLIGAVAGYLFLVIAGPEFLPLAAASSGLGLTL